MVTKSNQLAKRPLVSVLESYSTPTATATQRTKTQSNLNQSSGNADSVNSVEQSADEIREQLNELKTVQEKFLYVCHNGSDDTTRELLKEQLESTVKVERILDRKNSNMTLLHILASKNKVHSMELLLQSTKIKVDTVDSVHATPLLHAAANNAIESAAFLLSKGANVNMKDTWGKFPLLVALKNKHYKMAELLCGHQSIDVHARSVKGNTVLHIVSAEGDIQAVQILMEKANASPLRRNNDEDNVLQYCISQAHIVQYICSKVDKKTLTKLLLNVNLYGSTVLHECATQFISLVSVLKSLDLSELSMSQVDALLNTANKHGETPLILAAKNSNVDMVRLLCQCEELKVNQGDEDGNTALYHAASTKSTEIVEMINSVGGAFKATNYNESMKKENKFASFAKSLRTLLVIILSLMAFVCVVTIAAISLAFFASNVSSSTETIRSKYFEEVVGAIGRQVEDITLGFRMAYLNPNLDPSDMQSVIDNTGPIFFASLQALPLVKYFYCAKPNAALAGWEGSGNSSVVFYSNYDNYTYSITYDVTDYKNYSDITKFSISGIDYIVDRPTPNYIKNAMAHDDVIWTESYTSEAYPGILFLTIGKGIRDPVTNEFLGSCQFDTDTFTLNQYLSSSATQQDSVTVVIEGQTGYLIATSDPTVPLFNQTEQGEAIRYDGSDSRNKVMVGMLRYARRTYGGSTLPRLEDRARAYGDFRSNGERYILNIGVIKNEFGLHWIVVQALPIRNFYQKFYTSIIVMVCATVALLFVSTVLSVIIAAIFMRPIDQLIKQADAIKLLQLESVEKNLKQRSLFTEIATLQNSFLSMTSRLKQFRNFIPDHILAVIEAEIGDKSSASANKGADASQTSEPTRTNNSDTVTGTRGSFSGMRKQNTKDMVNQALNSSLVAGNVTVMTIQLPDFSQILELYGPNEIDETSKELLSQFMDVIRIHKGQFVSISSTKAVVAWNTFIKQSDHRSRACKSALACIERLKKLHEEWKTTNLPLLEVSIGIANDTVYYGNMGTDRMKFFSLVGSAVKRSSNLCKVAAKWGSVVVCDANVNAVVHEEYELRPLLSSTEGSQQVIVYELGEQKAADAWANELQADSKASKHEWSDYREAFSLLTSGQHEEAYELFVKYLEKNSHDVAAQNMIGICRAQKESGGTSNSVLSDNTITLIE